MPEQTQERKPRAESVPEDWRGEVCARCIRHVVPGFAVPDETWALVVGDEGMVLCLTCFDELAAPKLVQWENVVELFPVSTEAWRHDEATARSHDRPPAVHRGVCERHGPFANNVGPHCPCKDEQKEALSGS